MLSVAEVKANECTGCAACADYCPKGCIAIRPDDEGFARPEIDGSACVGCARCLGVCPATNGVLRMPHRGLLARSTLPEADRSSSGGMAYALALHFVKSGGAVVSCALDDEGKARHIVVEDEKGLRSIQGSKYVQSDARGAYALVDKLLRTGRRVLFIGTPCQVAAVERACGGSGGLLTVDLICHGVPSPKFWERDLAFQNANGFLRSRCSISFRAHSSRSSASFELSDDSSKLAIPYEKDAFYASFIRNASLRESCYSCRFAKIERPGDLTIGDCATRWDHPDFHPTIPVSSVLVNSSDGDRAVHELVSSGWVDFEPLDMDAEARANKQLSAPSMRPEERDVIYADFESMPYAEFKDKYATPVTFAWHAKRLVKAIVPVGVRALVRKALGRRRH